MTANTFAGLQKREGHSIHRRWRQLRHYWDHQREGWQQNVQNPDVLPGMESNRERLCTQHKAG
jgi:hypothetical protein